MVPMLATVIIAAGPAIAWIALAYRLRAGREFLAAWLGVPIAAVYYLVWWAQVYVHWSAAPLPAAPWPFPDRLTCIQALAAPPLILLLTWPLVRPEHWQISVRGVLGLATLVCLGAALVRWACG